MPSTKNVTNKNLLKSIFHNDNEIMKITKIFYYTVWSHTVASLPRQVHHKYNNEIQAVPQPGA